MKPFQFHSFFCLVLGSGGDNLETGGKVSSNIEAMNGFYGWGPLESMSLVETILDQEAHPSQAQGGPQAQVVGTKQVSMEPGRVDSTHHIPGDWVSWILVLGKSRLTHVVE